MKNVDTSKSNFERILTIVSLVGVAFAAVYVIYLGFANYWYIIHSDIAGDLVFVREARRQGSLFPYGWPHLQEMRFVHLTTVILLVYYITNNINLSYPIAVSIMLVLNMYLFYYMLSYRRRPIMPVAMGMMVLLLFFARYDMFSVFSLLWINGSLSTSLATMFITIGVYMRLKTNKIKGKKAAILFVLVSVLSLMQGVQSTRMLMALYLPLFIIELYPIVINIIENKQVIKKLEISTKFAIACLLCNIAGVLLILRLLNAGVVLSSFGLVTTGLGVSPHYILWAQLQSALSAFFLSIGLGGGFVVYSTAGMAHLARMFGLIALVVIMRKTSAALSKDRPVMSMLIMATIVTSLAMVLTYTGVGERFIFMIQTAAAVIFVIILDFFAERKQKILASITIFFIFMVSALSIATLSFPDGESLRRDRQAVADFIVSQGLTIGYGEFWNGLVLTAFADFEIDVIPISHVNFSTQLHGVTLERFGHQGATFLVLTSPQRASIAAQEHLNATLEMGRGYTFNGGWMVYIFDFNPFN